MNTDEHEFVHAEFPHSMTALFNYCRQYVDESIISRFCPADPGYKAYVQEWSDILRKGSIPEESNFEVSETVGLTMWADTTSPDFLRFRCFTNSVALPLMCVRHAEVVFDLNYPLARLLSDTVFLQDARLLLLIKSAIEACYECCRQSPRWSSEFVPWCAYALTLVAACRGDEPNLTEWAARTVDLEAELRRSISGDSQISDMFLFGTASYGTLLPVWFALTELLLPAYRYCESVALILDALGSYHVEPSAKRRLLPMRPEHLTVFQGGTSNHKN